MYLSYLTCIKKFGQPPSANCPVNRNVNDEECLPLVMHSSLFKLRMTFTLTKYLENSPSHNRDFPFTTRNELHQHTWCALTWGACQARGRSMGVSIAPFNGDHDHYLAEEAKDGKSNPRVVVVAGLLLILPATRCSIPQGRICSDSRKCCHNEMEDTDQDCYLTQSPCLPVPALIL